MNSCKSKFQRGNYFPGVHFQIKNIKFFFLSFLGAFSVFINMLIAFPFVLDSSTFMLSQYWIIFRDIDSILLFSSLKNWGLCSFARNCLERICATFFSSVQWWFLCDTSLPLAHHYKPTPPPNPSDDSPHPPQSTQPEHWVGFLWTLHFS